MLSWMTPGIPWMAGRRLSTCPSAGTARMSASAWSRDCRTLLLMPMPRGPRATGSHWPAYAHDWADVLAQQEADGEQKQRDQREANRTRVRPPHLIRSGRSEYSQSMRNARWVYQGDIGLPLRFGRFQ